MKRVTRNNRVQKGEKKITDYGLEGNSVDQATSGTSVAKIPYVASIAKFKAKRITL